MWTKSEYVQEVFRIAKELGYKIETCRGKNIPQINFGNKKLHLLHIEGIFPHVLENEANISNLIESVAPGRPCSHAPFKKIIGKMISEI